MIVQETSIYSYPYHFEVREMSVHSKLIFLFLHSKGAFFIKILDECICENGTVEIFWKSAKPLFHYTCCVHFTLQVAALKNS